LKGKLNHYYSDAYLSGSLIAKEINYLIFYFVKLIKKLFK